MGGSGAHRHSKKDILRLHAVGVSFFYKAQGIRDFCLWKITNTLLQTDGSTRWQIVVGAYVLSFEARQNNLNLPFLWAKLRNIAFFLRLRFQEAL